MGRQLTRQRAVRAIDAFAMLLDIAKHTAEHAHGRPQKDRLACAVALIDEMLEAAEAALDALPPSGPRRRIGGHGKWICTACYPHPWHKGPCPHCVCGRKP